MKHVALVHHRGVSLFVQLQLVDAVLVPDRWTLARTLDRKVRILNALQQPLQGLCRGLLKITSVG